MTVEPGQRWRMPSGNCWQVVKTKNAVGLTVYSVIVRVREFAQEC